MKIIFFLLLIASPPLAFSQHYPDSNSYCSLEPYYDYALCAKGLKDTSGNIVLEPRYSEIRLLPNDLLLVCENELYGVLDCNFNTVIPITYKKLRFLPKYYRAVRCGQNYNWLFETNEGTGLMNSSLEVILPPVNDRVEVVNVEPQIRSNSHLYSSFGAPNGTASLFRVTRNDSSYVCNEFGKLIVPSHFKNIHCYTVKDPSSTPKLPNGIFFLAQTDSSQVIISENGELLFKAPLDVALHVFSVDSSTVVQVTEPDQTMHAVCLETGTTIEKSKSTLYKDNLVLFVPSADNKSFRVYGKNLTHLFTGKNWNFITRQLSIDGRESILLLHGALGDRRTTLLSKKGEVFIDTKDLFYQINSESEEFFWTVPEDLSEKEDTLRIYFSNGELKHEYLINGIGSTHFFRLPWSSSETEQKLDKLLFIKQGSKWGALDRRGELIIPFQFDSCGIPYGSKYFKLGQFFDAVHLGYFLTQKGKMGSMDRSGNILFKCKYDTTFCAEIDLTDQSYFQSHEYPDYFHWERKTYSSFAIRKNQLVTLKNGKLRVCDSTFLPFTGPLLLVGHALIDYNGKVIREIKSGEIHKTSKFLIHIQGDVAQVILMNGEEGLKIDRFKSAQVEGDYLKVKLTDETVGVISLDGKRWLYKPKYFDITFTKVNSPAHAWVKEDSLQTYLNNSLKILMNYEGRWMLVDTADNQLYDFSFKTPVNLVYAPSAVFESGGRYGLIDSSLNVPFEPVYELVHPLRYSKYVLLYKGRSWQLGHSSGDMIHETFSSISSKEVNGTMVVFSFTETDTLIGFVRYQEGFRWVVPLTEMHELISNESLHLALNDELNPHYPYAVGVDPKLDSNDVWRVQNNTLIVAYALQNQCHIQMLPIAHPSFVADFEFYNPQSHIPTKQFYDEINIRSFGQVVNTLESKFTYPTELKEFHKSMIYNPTCRWLQFQSDELLTMTSSLNCHSLMSNRRYTNYVYFDSVQQIELSDILQHDAKTSAFLRNFIVEKLTVMQSGVEVCPDLDKSEEFMWSNFHFIQNGIRFPDLELILPYSTFEPYLTELGKRLKPW